MWGMHMPIFGTASNTECACGLQAVAIKAGVAGQQVMFPIKSMTDESGLIPALQALVHCTAESIILCVQPCTITAMTT